MNENKLKPFDLEKAKQGAKVITRDGRPARIICWDIVDYSDWVTTTKITWEE